MIRSWVKKLNWAASRRCQGLVKKQRRQLGVERLESREVPATGTWIQAAAGTYNWGDAANWQGGVVPNAVGDTANINSALAGNETINLGGTVTLGTLNIGASTGTDTFTITGGVLNLAAASGSATIAKTSGGADAVNSLITLASNLNVNDSTTAGFALNGNISESGSSKSITVAGTDTVVLGGANTFSGGVTDDVPKLAIVSNTGLGSGTYTVGTLTGSRFLWVQNNAAVTVSNNIVLPAPTTAETYEIRKGLGENPNSGAGLNLTGIISGGNANVNLELNADSGGDNTTTYRLAGNNTFLAGVIHLNRGCAIVTSPASFGAAMNTVQLDANNNQTLGDLRFEGSINLANPLLLTSDTPINAQGNSVTLSGQITGGNQIFQVGTGTLTISNGTNNYSGNTTVESGTLLLTNASGSATGTGNVAVNTGGNLGGSGAASGTVTAAAGSTISGTLSVGGQLTVSGTLQPAGPSTTGIIKAAGGLTLSPGSTFAIALNGTVAGSSYDQVQATGGTVTLTGANLSGTIGYTPAIGDSYAIITSSSPVVGTFNNLPDGIYTNIGGVEFQLTYHGGTGGNNVVLTRKDQPLVYVDTRWTGFTGGTVIPDADPVAAGNQPATYGTTAFSSVNAAVAAAPLGAAIVVNGNQGGGGFGNFNEAVNLSASDTLIIQYGPVSFGSLAGPASTGALELNGSTLTIGGNNSSTSFSPLFAIGTGGIIKTGTGAFSLDSAELYTGATTVNSGSLIAAAANAFPSSAIEVQSGAVLTDAVANAFGTTSSVTVDAGGDFQLGGFNQTVGTFAGAGTVENASATAATLTVGTANNSTTFSGLIRDGSGGGSLSLTQSGSGTLTVSGAANSYTGVTTVSGGGVLVAAVLANGGLPSSIGASSNVAANVDLAGGTLRYTGPSITIDRNFTAGTGGGAIDVSNVGSTLTLPGTISGGNVNSFDKAGLGTLNFTTNNALNTGDIEVLAGTLGFANLTLSGSTSTAGVQRALTIDAGAFANSYGQLNTTADPNIGESVCVTGAGTLNLDSTTNNGVTSFDIFFNSNDNIGSGANNGSAITVANINLGSSQRYFSGINNHNGYGVYFNATDAYITSAISGSGGITINAQPGQREDLKSVPFAFGGVDTFTGPFIIEQGSIYLINPQALQGNDVQFNVPYGNYANLFLFGNNVSIGNLSSTGNGSIYISNGNFAPGTPVADARAGFADGTLTINETRNTTFGGVLSDFYYEYANKGGATQGALDIVKTGSGTLTLAPAPTQFSVGNIYTGTTTINGGALDLENTVITSVGAGSATGTGAITVNSGGSLIGQGSASGNVTVNSGGVVALSGTGNLTGDISVSSGGLLSGTGLYGGTNSVSGSVSPGFSPVPGIVNANVVNFSSTGVFSPVLNGIVAGASYSQLASTGTVSLNGATLNATANYTYRGGDVLTIINAAAVNGTFAGLADGATATISGQAFTIHYTATTVTLTRQASTTLYVSPSFTGPNGTVIPDADPVAPGNQPATIGTTAFATVGAAIAAATAGATIVVNQGTYNEAVVVNKAIDLVVQQGAVTFTSLADTVANAGLVLSGVTLTVGDSNNETFSSSIVGSGSLTKVGSGTLTLSGTNTYTGATTISSGTLAAGSVTGFSALSAFSDAGDLRLNGFSGTIASLTGAGTVEDASATSATLTVGSSASTNSSFSGLLQDGSGGGLFSLNKAGNATLTLTGAANTYTGVTTVSGGILSVGTLANGGVASSIGASSNAAANLVIAGGDLQYTGASASIDRSLTVGAGGGTVEVTRTAATLTDSGTINGGFNTFNKAGSGTYTLTANNALVTGPVNVNAGTLGFATQTFSRLAPLTIAAGAFANSSGTLNLSVINNSGSGSVDVAGPGTLNLVSTTNSSSSPDLFFAPDQILSPHSDTVYTGTQITANVNLGSIQRYIFANTGGNSISKSVAGSEDARISGSISGSGGITYIAQNVYQSPSSSNYMETPLSLAGANTFTGPLQIERGSIYLRNANALNGNQVIFDSALNQNAALFLYGNNTTISNLSSIGAGSALIANGNVNNGFNTAPASPVTLTINQTASTTYNGLFVDAQAENDSTLGTGTSGALSLDLTGSGTLTLVSGPSYVGVSTATANTYSGGTTVDGTLLVNEPAGTSTGNVTVVNGSSQGILGGTGSIVPASGNTVTVNAGAILEGPTTISAPVAVSGTYSPGGAGTPAIVTTGNLTFNSGSTFNVDINGANPGTGYDEAISTGTITLTGASLTGAVGFNAGNNAVFTIMHAANPIVGTFTGAAEGSTVSVGGLNFKISYLNDSVTLTRQTLVYYADTRWTGLANGTVIPDADPVAPGNQPATIGTTAFASVNAAIAAVPQFNTVVVNGDSNGVFGQFNEDVNVNKSISIVIQNGPVSFNALTGNVPSAAISLNGSTLTEGGTNESSTFPGSISGTGGITKTGSGTFTLTGSNNYTGQTTVSTGVLSPGGTNTLSPNSTVSLASGALLILNGFNTEVGGLGGTGTVEDANATSATITVNTTTNSSFGGVLQDGAGGGQLSLATTGTGGALTLTGTNSSYSGTTTVGGTLALVTLSNGGANSSIGSSSSAATNLVIQGGGTLEYAGTTNTSIDRNITIGLGGGNFATTNAGGTPTYNGQLDLGGNALGFTGAGNATFTGIFQSGSTGTITMNGTGTVAFTNNLAFGTAEDETTNYGSVDTGNIIVNSGNFQTGTIRLNPFNPQRVGPERIVEVAAGAYFTVTGTIWDDQSGKAVLPAVMGVDYNPLSPLTSVNYGTLRLRNPSPSATNPSYSADGGPAGGDGGPYGSNVAVAVDTGVAGVNPTQWIVGKSNRNDIARYAGDLRFDYPISGSAGLQFYGLASNSGHNMHFVLNDNNSGFMGPVFVANSDLELVNNNSLSAANSVTFNDVINRSTAYNINATTGVASYSFALYTWGHNVTIGSLNEIPAGNSQNVFVDAIRNGSITGAPNGGSNSNNNGATFGVAPGLDANSTLTITQTVNGTFGGVISDGPNDDGTGDIVDGNNNPIPYDTMSIDLEGSATLNLTGANTYSGTTNIGGGTLIVSGSLNASSPVTVTPQGTLGGTGTVGPVSANGVVIPGSGGTGILTTGNDVFGGSGTYIVAINSGTVGTGYDQLNATGNTGVDLTAHPTLNVSVGGSFSPTVGEQFDILTESGGGATSGYFNGLPEGATFSANGHFFTISYVGGTSSHDVVLTAAVASAPIAISSININAGTVPIISASETGNIVTIVTDGAHGFVAGDPVVIANVGGGYNGHYTIAGASANSFTINFGSTTGLLPVTNAGVAIDTAKTGGALVNGHAASGHSASYNSQRSVVDSIVYTFNQAVNLGAGAFTITVLGQGGQVPSVSYISPDGGTTWVLTFSGAGVTANSIANGEYQIVLNSSAVTAAVGSGTLAASDSEKFYRLFGDTIGNGSHQRVNAVDRNVFNGAFGSLSTAANFLAYLDFDGNGRVAAPDRNAFNGDFGVVYSGFTATI